MKITMIGTGYVGLVTGTCLADMGNEVACIDIDQNKIKSLKEGHIPIYEPGLEELVHRNVAEKRLTFSTDLAGCLPQTDVCFIAVGTPPDEDGSADRRYVLEAARSIGNQATHGLVVAIKSTVPVGTCERVQQVIDETLAKRKVDVKIPVVSNPEFLKEGKAVEDFLRPDRIVVGINDEEAGRVMYQLYQQFVRNGHPILLMKVKASELTKYAANAMLATRISFMNELARLCDTIGADVMDVRRGMGTDSRIGMSFLYAGIGYGGSCFPKDVQALAQVALESDCSAHILEAVVQVNKHQKMMLANRILNRFNQNLKGKHFGLWGLSFKPNTDDIREAPAFTIIKRLTECGATIAAFDPVAMPNAREALKDNAQVSFVEDQYEAAKNADALILATEWRAFRNPNLGRLKNTMKSQIIFDGRNQYEPEDILAEGFEYFGIGRGLA
ncbi:MAG: UDP-glucose/GDP-mannose dehydrogenase family protein [Myxococcota bacterium]|nr:UDP-glucose/GDP-mannose dehydrogenase family protein [Myxococcota bacterium]